MNEKEEDFNFFSATVKKVNTQSKSKIVLLGTAIGFSFALFISAGLYFNHRYEAQDSLQLAQAQENAAIAVKNIEIANNNRNKLMDDAQKNLYSKITSISEQDFNQYLNYLKSNQNSYDSRVNLISDSLIEAQKIDRKMSLDGLGESQKLQNALAEYKKSYEMLLSQNQFIYQTVKEKGSIPNIQSVENFITAYNNYKLGMAIKNVALEQVLNRYLYAKNQGNVNYNLTNHIIDKYRQLVKETANNLASFTK